MSSFYGAGGNVTVNVNSSGDSNFTTLTGTDSSPIVLNTLDTGNYLISGSYTYTSTDTDIKTASYQTLVTIMEDTSTSNKVAKFETCEDEVYYVYTVIFYDNETCLVNKLSFEKTEEDEGIVYCSEDALPETGTAGVLYVTEIAIYQWIDGTGYVNLSSSPVWDDLTE